MRESRRAAAGARLAAGRLGAAAGPLSARPPAWLAHSQGLGAHRVDAVLAQAGLEQVARRKAGGFSLGMRQRLGLAAAMLGDPPIVMLDEPFNGLDPESIVWMRGFLRQLAAAGRAVLVPAT